MVTSCKKDEKSHYKSYSTELRELQQILYRPDSIFRSLLVTLGLTTADLLVPVVYGSPPMKIR
jgi:hypothetical protein